MTGRVSNGVIRSLFKEWIVLHSKADAAMEFLDELREARRHSRWDTEASGASLFSASHCGKSHIINKIYFSRRILPELRKDGIFHEGISDGAVKKLQRRFLYVKVPEKPNIGDFGTNLLRVVHDPFYQKREKVLDRIRRAEDIMNNPDDLTELLALDNFDQLSRKADRQTMKEASEVQDVVKTMMENGIPIVFTGLYNAHAALNNMQIKNRVMELDIMPFRFEKDLEEFCKYVAGIELLMIENCIFDVPSGLYEDDLLIRLYYASQGRIGVLSNLIRDAAKLASTEKCQRIERIHLQKAVDDYPLKKGICEYNPFLIDKDKKIEIDCKTRVAADEKLYDKRYMEYFQ
ncbi:hypothetical protein FZ934_08255 [Rhizobium grahamii]|uniref:AAA family ATPase n=1 Tax=Rhizobium grahamii TaxID=1120045 RepID=A0A5Q0C593_9HYPH|nr:MULTISPECIES: TniB family NTP-binding protein [Rhizobium]QFY60425.1 hypothetical protein FZ934_08255 [Rhizobium grahamii]QRM50447.1 hypothetical protein F3Y33_14635 [Rhizobium sp. BG6]